MDRFSNSSILAVPVSLAAVACQDPKFTPQCYVATELFYFQQKIEHLTSQLKYSDGLVDFKKKQHVRDAEETLKDDLRLLQERIGRS